MSGKQLPPPAGGQDLTALLRSRHVAAVDVPAPTPAPAPETTARSAPPAAQRPTRAKGPEMDRRSWYMPRTSADALAAAVEELHFATRRPKHVIMSALVAVALEHLDEVEQRTEQ